jgi:hypothetical protein
MKFPPPKKNSKRFGGFLKPRTYDIISLIISWDENFVKFRQWKHCHIQYQIMKIENYSDPHININFLVQKTNPLLPISHVVFIWHYQLTMHKGWIWDTQLDTKPESP